jgi:hypothetical protein
MTDTPYHTCALVLCLALTGCASHEWTRADTRYQALYTVALAADAYTASHIHEHPWLREASPFARPFIGESPDPRDVWLGAIAMGIAHYFIARRLGQPARRIWQAAPALIHGSAALGNCPIASCEYR